MIRGHVRNASARFAAVSVILFAAGIAPGAGAETAQPSPWRLSQVTGSLPVGDQDPAQEPNNLVAEKRPPETNWSAKCVEGDNGIGEVCRVVQNILLTKTRQRLLSVVVRVPQSHGRPSMTLNLPHGLYLPAGTQLQIDRARPTSVAIETCDARGCYAAFEVDETLLLALKRGNTLTVTFENLARKPIAVPVTLVGFTAAYQKIE